MGIWELFVLAVGLSMDAFAVSVCKGLSLGKIKSKHMCIAGLWFGGFQALMPLVGYFLGSLFADIFTKYAHWIAFVLLVFIGGSMIKEAFGKEEINASMNFQSMLLLAIATSIDALGSRCQLRLPAGENHTRRFLYRCHYLPVFCRRCKNRQHFRR